MCKYRPRWFYSKKALLILVWITALSFSFQQFLNSSRFIISRSELGHLKWLAVVPIATALLSAVVSGWLADAKLGNYRVVKAGLILLFIASVLASVLVLSDEILQRYKGILITIFITLASLLGIGSLAFATNSFQLGLDQMPDASSSRISSFITWYLFSGYAGFWIGDILTTVERTCINDKQSVQIRQVLSLAPVICIGIALVTNFLFARRLIIEPKAPQSIKTIYRVLKFAAKHKAPLNRSALTYWEEDIPSRMDLGKSRYGGPFTTEQVEDVKTILRLLIVSFSLWVIAVSLGVQPTNNISFHDIIPNWKWSFCQIKFFNTSTGTLMYILVGILIYELVIFPILRNKLPSILKRIGIASFMITLASSLLLAMEIVYSFYPETYQVLLILRVLYLAATTLCMQFIGTSMLEFVCAQAPYNMRGLFAGYVAVLVVFIFSLIGLGREIYRQICVSGSKDNNCDIVFAGVKAVTTLLVFIQYCVVAHWYKRRVRDEDYDTQRVVEEIYDRYLTSAVNHYRRH